jgi:hypothetical protein
MLVSRYMRAGRLRGCGTGGINKDQYSDIVILFFPEPWKRRGVPAVLSYCTDRY